MVLFPNCKINLGLHVIRKRGDGYHDIETVFYPVAIQDALEVIQSSDEESNVQFSILNFQFSTSGVATGAKPEDNLCVKAYRLLRDKFPEMPPTSMHLHKTIPPGAGLGGGSADGAFALKLLNQKCNLALSTEQLLDMALQLGSDCPFFIINKPCLASGRGEFLKKIELDLSSYKLVIANPGIHVSTAEAFSHVLPAQPSKSIKEIIGQPLNTWKEELRNDFEDPVFKRYPEVQQLKDKMYEAGAIYASMSGSGSSVFGIFETTSKPQLALPSHYFVKELSGQF